jgi:hypothetical protein
MFNNLVLRVINSPYGDMTRGAVLSHQDVDNNFIYLKGNLIQSGSTSNNGLFLTKINGDVISIPLNFTGTTTGSTVIGLSSVTFSDNVLTIKDVTGGTFATYINILSISSTTINYNVSPSETNSCFTNEGATTGIIFTLPPPVKNLNYTFILENSNSVTISATTGSTIVNGLNITSSGGSITSIDGGSSITLVAINSVKWITTSFVGTWF